jgi:hypothetical protein
VGHRPASELIQSLRATLQRLEENFATPEDQPILAELKRILLHRIADLEFVGAAVERASPEEARPQDDVPQDAVQLLPVIQDDPEAA